MRTWNRPLLALTGAMILLALVCVGGLLLDPRTLLGQPIWAKPLTFSVSLALYGPTLAWMISLVRGGRTHRVASKATGSMPAAGAHAVGVPDGGPGLPFLGWSTTGGDLRIGHFVGLHGLQAVPLLALGLALLAGRVTVLASERVRTRLVRVGAVGWLGLTVLLTWQALRAQPLLAPDALTVGAALALVVLVVGAAVVVLVRGARSVSPVGVSAPAAV